MSSSMSALGVEDVTKVFTPNVCALQKVSLQADDGDFLVLVGPSGCGKTTLLRIIAGLDQCTEGRITIGGVNVTELAPRDRDIAMVFQDYALYPNMSVKENLAFGLKTRRVVKPEREKRIAAVAEMLGLQTMLNRKPSALSGGERQRVAMGRALVRDPSLFLMDEPLSNLDAALRASTRAQIHELHRKLGRTTVYVTHDQVEAMTLGTRVAVLRGGMLQQCAAPDVVFNAPANLFVAMFMGSPPMNVLATDLHDRGTIIVAGRTVELSERARGVLDRTKLRRVVVGLRPTDLRPASTPRDGEARLTVVPSLVERLGDGTLCHFGLDENTLGAVSATGGAMPGYMDAPRRNTWLARLDPLTDVGVGVPLALTFSPDRLYLFDEVSGVALDGPRINAVNTSLFRPSVEPAEVL
jgi:multiple sugar transport system ATP-binding protein